MSEGREGHRRKEGRTQRLKRGKLTVKEGKGRVMDLITLDGCKALGMTATVEQTDFRTASRGKGEGYGPYYP